MQIVSIGDNSLLETICMKCQIVFSLKNKKNISKSHLLKILPRVLSINVLFLSSYFFIKII